MCSPISTCLLSSRLFGAGVARFILVFTNQTLQLEGLSVLDTLGLGARTGTGIAVAVAVHVGPVAVGVGVLGCFLVFLFFIAFGPSVSGIDVEENVDNYEMLAVISVIREKDRVTYRGRG